MNSLFNPIKPIYRSRSCERVHPRCKPLVRALLKSFETSILVSFPASFDWQAHFLYLKHLKAKIFIKVIYHPFVSTTQFEYCKENSATIMDADYNETIQFLVCTDNSSERQKLLVSVICIILSIATIIGNVLTLVALRKVSSLYPPSKLLYSCLAVTDLFVGMIAGPAGAVHFMMWNIHSDSRQWLDLCVYSADIASVSFTVLTTVSLQTLTVISIDRLLALMLGLRYRQVVTLRRVQALAASVWIPSIAYAPMLLWENNAAKIFLYTLESFCLLVSAVCYSKIFLILRHHVAEVQDHLQGTPSNDVESLNLQRYKKTVSTAMWVLISLVICYIPYIIVTVIYTVNGPFSRIGFFWGLTGSFVFLSSALNPLLYCWKIKDVRQAVKMTVRQVLCLTS